MEKVAQDDPFRQQKVYIPLYLRTQHKKAAARVFISAEQKYLLQGYIPIMLMLNYQGESHLAIQFHNHFRHVDFSACLSEST